VLQRALPPFAALALLASVWEIVVRLHLKPEYVIPSPSGVWSSLADQWRQGHVTEAVVSSLARGGAGFALALTLGTPLGLVIARVRVVRLAIGSLISALQSLPSVTWVPLGIVWFGLSEATILFVVVMGALPSIAGGLALAVDTIPPGLLRTGAAMGAGRWQMYRHVILPAALPGYIAAVKQAWAFSWRSLMAAELITFSPELRLGLGQLLDSGRQLNDMSLVVSTVALILAVGVAVDVLALGPLHRRVLRVRGLTAA